MPGLTAPRRRLPMWRTLRPNQNFSIQSGDSRGARSPATACMVCPAMAIIPPLVPAPGVPLAALITLGAISPSQGKDSIFPSAAYPL
jgi:hypothetical protein